jgi:aliphatic nitrilase
MINIDYNIPIFKAAAIQTTPVYCNRPVYLNVKATLEKACDLIHEAAANGARLVVFPETFIPGYPNWSLALTRQHEWTVIWRVLWENSVEVPGPETGILSKVAKETNTILVVGINERDCQYGGRMYNSALFISPVKGVLGVHRKLHPTLSELLYHTRGDGGDNLRVY